MNVIGELGGLVPMATDTANKPPAKMATTS